MPLPRKPQKLSIILSPEEVQHFLGCVADLKHHSILTTCYAAGLRISEAVHLTPTDIDSQRMVVRIEHGKGQKDRYVMLSPKLLEILRDYWRMRRPKEWLFPGDHAGQPITRGAVGLACAKAHNLSRLFKPVTPHSFRHAFAVHLLEAGADVRIIQLPLGHHSLATTAHYLRIATNKVCATESPFELLPRPAPTTPPPAKLSISDLPITRSALDVADIFCCYGEAYHAQHTLLSTTQRRAMTAIEICRTAALGGHVEACDQCGHRRIAYNSCRDRHCPRCQSLAREQWLEDRRAELLELNISMSSSHCRRISQPSPTRKRRSSTDAFSRHRRDAAHHCQRSQTSRRRDRVLAGRHPMDCRQTGLLLADPRALTFLPPLIPATPQQVQGVPALSGTPSKDRVGGLRQGALR